MAISTIYTFLMKGSGTSTITYSKLTCINSFPDLGSAPEQIDTTTLCNTFRTYIPGVQDTGALEFECWYTPEVYAELSALAGVDTPYAVWFGGTDGSTPTGSNGKFSFSGDLRVNVNGGGVNEAVSMTITIFPSTDITFAES